MTVQELILWRDEVILSFNSDKIMNFMKYWGIPIPEDDTDFWDLVRRAAREIVKEEANERLSVQRG